MNADEEKKKKLQDIVQKKKALQEEKERFASQQCATCINFTLYRAEFYAGEWGYCNAHDRNVRRTQARYAWCKYEVKP